MKRATQIAAPSPSSLLLLFLLLLLLSQSEGSSPVPSPWPDQFHALLYMNLTTTAHLQITHLWYEWPKRRNFNIMQKQLGVLLYDLEWNNGTSYYYTLGDHGTCNVIEFEVGIPRPDWLQGANYLGQEYTDGFLCNVWEKLDFIWYYEDVVTKRPVRWDFYDGISTHVMTFEVGAVLDDSHWQAPAYCFRDTNKTMKQRDPIPTPARDEINISEREMLDFSTRKLVLGSYHQ